MSAKTPLTVANNFDPSVSGLANPVGTIVETVNGTKAWMKWGTGNTQWSPLHTVSAAFGSALTTWDTTALVANLACDTLGGFRLLIQGTMNANGNIGLRVNGSGTFNTQFVEFFGYSGSANTLAVMNNVPLNFIVNNTAAKPFSVVIECVACKSGTNLQLISIMSTFYNSGISGNLTRHALVTLTGIPVGEIQSVGVVSSVAGALNAITTATLVRV